jgi:hypothetical protein
MPKRIIFRHRSFITFAEGPGQARRSALADCNRRRKA